MKSCKDYQKDIYMDVTGEIPPDKKTDLENHILFCARCKKEREELAALVDLLKKEIPQPAMSSFEASILRQKIRSAIAAQQRPGFLRGLFSGYAKLLIPVAGAACLFLVSFIGFRSWLPWQSHPNPNNTVARIEQNTKVDEKEIIENLDLLEQMDTLRVLVKVVDNKDII